MQNTRNKLYGILSIACLTGYVWVFFNLSNYTDTHQFRMCLIKNITNIPCPSCGVTRSVLSFFHGNFLQSLYWNPLGLIIVLILCVLPEWILFDIVTGKDSLLKFYYGFEAILRRKYVTILAISLILLNWIWNIYKGL